MRQYYYKYELLNNRNEWEDFTSQVVGTTNVNLGSIDEIGSEDFGIDSLKKYMTFSITRNEGKGLTASPLLSGNQFQIGRRVRLKCRVAESFNATIYNLKGAGKNYLEVNNTLDVQKIILNSVSDGGKIWAGLDSDLEIVNWTQDRKATYIHFNRIVETYETVGILLLYTASDLDTERIEIEGTGTNNYFVDHINPDVVKVLGHYQWSVLTGHGYFSDYYFTDRAGIDYLWYPAEGNSDYEYWITSYAIEGEGVRFYFNKSFDANTRIVVGLFYDERQDTILFDGKIRSYTGTNYYQVEYEAQDFSYDLETMAKNKEYPKNVTYEETIKQILIDNNKLDFEFIYDTTKTSTLTSNYEVENVTVWDAIQKLAIAKGWALYFQYNTQKNAQVLVFEDATTMNYVTYQLLKRDIVGDITFEGSLSRVRNVVNVIYYDENNSNKVTTLTIQDNSSIKRYRENSITLGLDLTEDVITNATTAQSLAEQCLEDLKDPVVTYVIGCTLLPRLKLNDEFWHEQENINNGALKIRAYSIEHSISVDDKGIMTGTTTIKGSSKAEYKLNEWLYNDSYIKENKEIIIVR